jgi:hypothetical protein
MMFYWLGRLDTNVMVAIADGIAGLVGLVLAGNASRVTSRLVTLPTISM